MVLRDGIFADYLANELGGRLCSQRLKEVIELHKSPSDEIGWLQVDVVGDKQRMPYALLHFPSNADVLDISKTKFVGSLIIKPTFDKLKVQKHRIFGLPSEESHRTYVSAAMRLAIEAAEMTGLGFSAKRLS